jgi:hypothetical protein
MVVVVVVVMVGAMTAMCLTEIQAVLVVVQRKIIKGFQAVRGRLVKVITVAVAQITACSLVLAVVVRGQLVEVFHLQVIAEIDNPAVVAQV